MWLLGRLGGSSCLVWLLWYLAGFGCWVWLLGWGFGPGRRVGALGGVDFLGWFAGLIGCAIVRCCFVVLLGWFLSDRRGLDLGFGCLWFSRLCSVVVLVWPGLVRFHFVQFCLSVLHRDVFVVLC